jgi:hypothetical protein
VAHQTKTDNSDLLKLRKMAGRVYAKATSSRVG